MKIKINKILLKTSLLDIGKRSREVIKGKEYLVLGLKMVREGTYAFVISDYLRTPCWVPLLGCEIIDDYIPEYWIITSRSTEEECGMYYLPPAFDMDTFYLGYSFGDRETIKIIIQEAQKIEQYVAEKNKIREEEKEDDLNEYVDPQVLGDEISEYMNIEPNKQQLYSLANEIEKYLIKYDMVSWLSLTNGIKERCRFDYNEVDLAKDILSVYGGMGSFNDFYFQCATFEEGIIVNNKFKNLRSKLYMCCQAIIAKNTYWDLLDEGGF